MKASKRKHLHQAQGSPAVSPVVSPVVSSMVPSRGIVQLTVLILLLALAAAGAGVLSGGEGAPYPFTTLRGETVTIYGQGLYRYDTLMIGAGYRGTDWIMLVVGVPLLAYAVWRYRGGSLRGGLLLAGALAYVAYTYGSMALGAAYNNWFGVYVALFSLSLYTLFGLILRLPVATLPQQIMPGLPHRGLAAYHFVVGTVLFGVWFGMSLLPALLANRPVAELASYTTSVTHVFDLGLILPAALVAGVLILRRAPLGYLLTSILLVIGWTIGLGVAAAAAFQVAAGALTTGQVLVFVVPFLLLTAVGVGLTGVFLRHVTEEGVLPKSRQAHGLCLRLGTVCVDATREGRRICPPRHFGSLGRLDSVVVDLAPA